MRNTFVQPEVSVIITAYNTAAYIEKAIKTALSQTLKNIEVIVVDDCSTDATVEVAKRIQDERLTVITNPRNMGATASSNRAIRATSGKWVAVLDSDDWYAPERLERLVQVANAQNADVIVDDLFLIRDGEPAPWSTLLSESGETIPHICRIDPVFFVKTDVYGQRGLHLGLTKPLFKREFLLQHSIQYDETLTSAYDFWIDMECFMHGANFILVPEPYYFYRSRLGSSVRSDRIYWLDECCRKTADFMQQEVTQQFPELVDALAQQLANFERIRAYYRIVQPLKQGRLLAALAALVRNPTGFAHLLNQLPAILERRIQYFVFKNETAFEMLPRRQKMQA
ncbi:glycosyltransferase family 2 protein [Leptolyngbya sp. NK1-12]|uniref:glycosyltransferase family 2 protein n=1 Tax=Leptolyngbya sp. NK1-12 TaxID=2547451 RepID=UPI00292E31CA|nr:glycosyltransferase family 2 protein [Leptolyngbya sp. NK1-12]